jgi:hypothetical protein
LGKNGYEQDDGEVDEFFHETSCLAVFTLLDIFQHRGTNKKILPEVVASGKYNLQAITKQNIYMIIIGS